MSNRNTLKKDQHGKIRSGSSTRQVVKDSFCFSVYSEEDGVPVTEFLENIHKLGITKTRASQIFKLSRSTLANKITSKTRLVRTDALAAIRVEKLCNLAEKIVSNSLHSDAKRFNAALWLGAWIEVSQAALGGLKPSELLDTEAGFNKVIQVLGALESGAYL